jgi:L-amino acid N-acyltransferase YncA
MRARLAVVADTGPIARIYNQGIDDRTATFETTPRSATDVEGWLDRAHPVVVVVSDSDDRQILAFARSYEYRPRDCYRGVFEFSVYTDRSSRRRGAAMLAMRELVSRARSAGAWKLVSRVFVENDASRALLGTIGFREVGIYHRHAKLDGCWRDVVVMELFLAPLDPVGV